MQAADYIKKLYSAHPKPLYLSHLGGILKKNDYKVANLREFIESMDDFTIACGPEKERTAIAAISDKEAVEAMLNESAKKIESTTLKYLSKLPRNLLYAFASKQKAQPSVYVTDSSPYRFGFTKENDTMVEVQNDLLVDARVPLNLKRLEHEIADKLSTNIKKWIADNNFDLSTYVKDTQKPRAGDQMTLLEEMIRAIPANKRSKVVLPLDIIEYLVRKR